MGESCELRKLVVVNWPQPGGALVRRWVSGPRRGEEEEGLEQGRRSESLTGAGEEGRQSSSGCLKPAFTWDVPITSLSGGFSDV